MKDKQYYESLDKRTKEFKQWQSTLKEINVEPEPQETGLGDVLEKVLQSPAVKQEADGIERLEDIKITVTPAGLGDAVEAVLEHRIIKPMTKVIKKMIFKDGKDCGCKERKIKLNELLPRRYKAFRCLTYTEHKTWGRFVKERTLKIDRATIVMICKLYAGVFNRLYYEPCGNCSPKPLLHMIDKLDTVYNSYEK